MLSEKYNVIYLWLNTEVIVQVLTRKFDGIFPIHVYLCTRAASVILYTRDSQPSRHCTSLSTLKCGHPLPKEFLTSAAKGTEYMLNIL